MCFQRLSKHQPNTGLISQIPSSTVDIQCTRYSNTSASPTDSRSYHKSKTFAADIGKAIKCMDLTKPYRREVMSYFDEGDVDFARRRFDVIDVILRNIITPIEPFGIVDRDCVPPWAFALQLLTAIQNNILSYTAQLGRPAEEHYTWLDHRDVPVVRRILGVYNEIMVHALFTKASGSKDKIQHDIIIEFIWLTAVLHRFDDKKVLSLLPALPVIFSIWDSGNCTTNRMYFFMEAIYKLGPSPRVDFLEIPLFDNDDKDSKPPKPDWLTTLFPKPIGGRRARDRHCEWQSSLTSRTPALEQRLSNAQGNMDVLFALKALERFLSVMESGDAERFIKKGIFKVASDACWRGMQQADQKGCVSDGSERVSRIMSRLLENIYFECIKHVPRDVLDIMRSNMPNHRDFDMYRKTTGA